MAKPTLRRPPSRLALTRARASGFGLKLLDFLHEQKKHERAGPRTQNQLWRYFVEECHEPMGSNSPITAWVRRRGLPEARFVAHLERLMGAPWAYIDDAKTPWPPKGEDFRALCSVALGTATPPVRQRVLDAVRAALALQPPWEGPR